MTAISVGNASAIAYPIMIYSYKQKDDFILEVIFLTL